jgi:hypothetical protein
MGLRLYGVKTKRGNGSCAQRQRIKDRGFLPRAGQKRINAGRGEHSRTNVFCRLKATRRPSAEKFLELPKTLEIVQGFFRRLF